MKTEKLNMGKVKVRKATKLYGRLGGSHDERKYIRRVKHKKPLDNVHHM